MHLLMSIGFRNSSFQRAELREDVVGKWVEVDSI